jgi:squalene cyclase
MSTSLAEALAIVIPSLPREFFDEARLRALQGWARNAPPVAWAGFECPLGKGERWVDFHQGFHRGDQPYLEAWLENQARTTRGDDGWIKSLLTFCREWGRRDSIFFKSVPHLIFEYDVRDHPEQISSPSLFIALECAETDQSSEGHSACAAIKVAAARDALALFVDPVLVTSLTRAVERCLRRAPTNASVSHLGLMLARNTPTVRINVRNLYSDQFAPYLKALGWKVPTAEFEQVLADAFAFAERINLALDVGDEIGAAIGLECSMHLHNPTRWRKLLARLAEDCECTEEQYLGLQTWWGRESPALVKAPWPSNLLIAGLLETERLGAIDRYLSHVKVTWQPGSAPRFKCYFGFEHQFVSKPKTLDPESIARKYLRPIQRSEISPAMNELDRAITSGIDFLLGNRLPSGLWQDFPTTNGDDRWRAFGSSDEWVSLYVAATLASLDNDDARRAAAWVWQLLNRRRNGRGWGHSWQSPADADSTAWGLRLADAIGASAATTDARDFLRRHQNRNGGIATYLPYAAITEFAALQASDLNAWTEPHPCVTATTAHLREFQKDCLRFLRATQAADGSWDSYWWLDGEYTAGFATAALARSSDERDRACVTAAVRWAINRVGYSGAVFSAACKTEAPFATALNLHALLSAPQNAEARSASVRSVQWLLGEQRPDGSWPGSAWLKTPSANSHSASAPILALDRNANFTTATVLAALKLTCAIR